MAATAYLVMFPTADDRMGDVEMCISGVFLSREAAEAKLEECREEYAAFEDAEDEGWQEPYIHEMEIG